MAIEPDILGVTEPVTVFGTRGRTVTVPAKVDTGAWHCSIDAELLDELGMHEVTNIVPIANANGVDERMVVDLTFSLHGQLISTSATVADRSGLKNKILVGREVLDDGRFLVDPSKKLAQVARSMKTAAAHKVRIDLGVHRIEIRVSVQLPTRGSIPAFSDVVRNAFAEFDAADYLVKMFMRKHRISVRRLDDETQTSPRTIELRREFDLAKPLNEDTYSLDELEKLVREFKGSLRNYELRENIDLDPELWG